MQMRRAERDIYWWPKRFLKDVYSLIVRSLYGQPQTLKFLPDQEDSILMIRTDGLGDLVLALPLLRHLRKSFGSYRISLLTREEWVDLVQICPYVDEVISWNIKRYRRNIFYRLSFIRTLRKRLYKAVLHSPYSRESFSDELLCCCLAKQKIGFDGDLNNISLEEKVRNDRNYTRLIDGGGNRVPEISRNREFAAEVTGTRIESADFQPELWLTESDRAAARRLLQDAGLDLTRNPIAAILPGAAWKGREWPAEGYAEIADRIVEQYRMQILILGSPADVSVASSVASRMRSPCSNLAGKTRLRELAALFESCAFYIGNETGPLHLAVAAGIPTLCIIGGGHFGRFYPYGDLNRHRVVYKEMDCFNCNWKCIHETVRCIQEINVEDVCRHTQRLIEEVVMPERESHVQKSSNGVTLPR
jgi:ADP-heptose:LPS heptosyltransferase